jgi:antitoxin component YwqK of YwqJK toxin-antitoxin module
MEISKDKEENKTYKYYYSSGKLKKEETIIVDSLGNKVNYWKFYYENGVLKKEGIEKTGKWTFYSIDGIKESSTYYVDDVRHGHAIYYFSDGNKKLEGEYVNGKQNGVWFGYDEAGDTMSRSTYVNGECIEAKISYK